MAGYFMSNPSSKSESRRTSYNNDLDSSNDIFGETPESSPAVRPGFRQPLVGSTKPRREQNDVFVGETPESSPQITESNQVSSQRIPSDPADSGISDSGTKSKSVTPESRFVTPRSPDSRFTTPGSQESRLVNHSRSPSSRLMTPRATSTDHRSPKVVYASDSEEESEKSAQLISDDDDDESEQITNAAIISSDESGDESGTVNLKRTSHQNLISEDESDDDLPLARGNVGGKSRYQIVSDDEDSSISQEITKKNSGARPKSQQNNSRSFSQEQDEDVSRIVARKTAVMRISSSEDDEEGEDVSSPRKGSSTEEEILLTPPPSSPSSRAHAERSRRSEQNDSGPVYRKPDTAKSQPPGKYYGNQEVVTVSSDEDDVQVVQESTKAKFTEKDISELEEQIKKLKNCILVNNHMANTTGRRLPDGGASLRRTVQEDSIKMQKLRETLARARSDLYQSSGGVFQPQKPSMMKSISGSSLSSHGSSGTLSKSVSGSTLGGRSISGTNLGGRSVSGSSLPPINNSPQSQLERCRKKKQELENALKFSSRLSDGGDILRDKIRQTNQEIEALEKQVSQSDQYNFTDQDQENKDPSPAHSNQAYQNLKASLMSGMSMAAENLGQMFGMGPQQHLYGGRMTTSRQREVKNVTHDAMEKLHKSLETMPAEGDMEEQPKLLKSSITLFPHQKQALAWLLWREHQAVAPGGILADDMGLGKTLTMISLILKQNEIEDLIEEEDKDDTWKVKGVGSLIRTKTTLIICPASLIGQWENEIKNKVKSGVLRTLVYHGPKARNASAREMSKYDVIITTYGVILSEVKSALGDAFKEAKKLEAMGAAEEIKSLTGKLLSLAFQRIILDEAHQVRNPRSLQSQAVCKLRARRRWCVTGTPVQNKELDLYSLIRFLRCAPFDEYQVWKRWVENKSAQSIERMNALVKSLVLRRTKDQKSVLTGKVLVELPDKNILTHEIKLTDEEMEIYTEVEKFARGAMSRFMEQGEEDEARREVGLGSGISISGGNNVNSDFAFNPNKDEDEKVKAHHLLTLLLRLRQICCHPGLIKGMLDQETKEAEGIQEEGEELDLISKLEDMTINKQNKEPSPVKVLQIDNPVFRETAVSSKIDKVVTELRRLKEKSDEEGVVEKAVVVSQWTSMLNIVKHHVKEQGLKFAEINGQVNISSRSEIVENFNQNKRGPQIMLLSLSAGGVGLNLVGANHLFLLDVHWNPQLESQACDRIYRVGQTKDVRIHKFMVKETVEERIFRLQEKKLKLADDVLSGAKKRGANSLSLDDLKSLFGLK